MHRQNALIFIEMELVRLERQEINLEQFITYLESFVFIYKRDKKESENENI